MSTQSTIRQFILLLAIASLLLAPMRAFAVMQVDASTGQSPCHIGMDAGDSTAAQDSDNGMSCCDGDNHQSCDNCALSVGIAADLTVVAAAAGNTAAPQFIKQLNSETPPALLRPPKALQI